MSKSKKSTTGDYTVGYGRPPKETQFKKGKSGNPKGRPKQNKNFEEILLEELHAKIDINDKGVRKSISKMRAAARQFSNTVAKGDLKAILALLKMSGTSAVPGESDATDAADALPYTPEEQRILDNFLSRANQVEQGDLPSIESPDKGDVND